MKFLKFYHLLTGLSIIFLLSSCGGDDVPPIENEEEIITDVILTFQSTNGGTPILATAQDPDGQGPQSIDVGPAITLQSDTEYSMTITLTNAIAEEDITEEVKEEADEHMFFFGWTEDLFSDPAGDGNIDNRSDGLNYNDEDGNGHPLGLSTTWTTGAASEGIFRVVLKHQPISKSATSTVLDGETDVDLTWEVVVE